MNRNQTIATLAATAVGLTLLACGGAPDVTEGNDPQPLTTTSTAADTATVVPVGRALTVTADDATTQWTVTETKQDAKDDFAAPTGGRRYLSAHLVVKVTKGETFVSGGDLSLITTTGQVLTAAVAMFGTRKDFPATSIRQGQNADGWVFFEATPAQLKGARVQLTQMNLFGNDPVGYWRI